MGVRGVGEEVHSPDAGFASIYYYDCVFGEGFIEGFDGVVGVHGAVGLGCWVFFVR